MRIVAGRYRGKKIAWISGEKTRPTKDNVRESVFNILAHAPWADGIEGKNVLDVFAGTGAMGLEALSRGAQDIVLIENDREAIKVCEQNINDLKAQTNCHLVKKDIFTIGRRPATTAKRDLVFLDPPYGQQLGSRALTYLKENDWLDENAICVLEMADDKPETIPNFLEVLDERRYGISKIIFLIFK